VVQSSPRTFRHQCRRVLVNPFSSFVLGFAILCIVCSLPDQDMTTGSIIGGFVRHPLLRKSRSQIFPFDAIIYVVREPDGLRAIDEASESWDELSSLVQARPRDVFMARYYQQAGGAGFFAVTEWRRTQWVDITPMASPADPAELGLVRALAVRALFRGEDIDHARILETKDVRQSRRLWSGYAINLVTLLCIAAFVRSLWWVKTARQFLASARRRSRVRKALCTHCGYSIAGLTSAMCPECGRPINEKPPAPAEGSTTS
jgi:hypothetical protein